MNFRNYKDLPMNLKRIVSIIIITSLAFVLMGCSTNTAQETKDDSATYLVTKSDKEINKLINYFKTSYTDLYDKTQAATNADAEEIKKEIETLENNIDRVDEELTSAVEESKITQEAKVGYDTELETLKTDLDQLNKTLESK